MVAEVPQVDRKLRQALDNAPLPGGARRDFHLLRPLLAAARAEHHLPAALRRCQRPAGHRTGGTPGNRRRPLPAGPPVRALRRHRGHYRGPPRLLSVPDAERDGPDDQGRAAVPGARRAAALRCRPKLNNISGLANAERELHRANSLFSGWDRCTLTHLLRPDGTPIPWFRYPDARERPGDSGFQLPSGNPPAAGASQPPGSRRDPRRRPRPCRAASSGASRLASGEVVLSDLARGDRRRERAQIAFPPTRAGAPPPINDGATAAELAQAVSLLYGWSFEARDGSARYSLARPVLGPARGPVTCTPGSGRRCPRRRSSSGTLPYRSGAG